MPRLDDHHYREAMGRHVNDDLYDPYDRARNRGQGMTSALGLLDTDTAATDG